MPPETGYFFPFRLYNNLRHFSANKCFWKHITITATTTSGWGEQYFPAGSNQEAGVIMCHFYMLPRNAHEQKAQRAFASFNCRFHEVSHTFKKIAVFFFVCSLSVHTRVFMCVFLWEHTVAMLPVDHNSILLCVGGLSSVECVWMQWAIITHDTSYTIHTL